MAVVMTVTLPYPSLPYPTLPRKIGQFHPEVIGLLCGLCLCLRFGLGLDANRRLMRCIPCRCITIATFASSTTIHRWHIPATTSVRRFARHGRYHSLAETLDSTAEGGGPCLGYQVFRFLSKPRSNLVARDTNDTIRYDISRGNRVRREGGYTEEARQLLSALVAYSLFSSYTPRKETIPFSRQYHPSRSRSRSRSRK